MQVLGKQQLGRLPWLQTPTLKNSTTDAFYNLNDCTLNWCENEKKWRMDYSLQLAGTSLILFFSAIKTERFTKQRDILLLGEQHLKVAYLMKKWPVRGKIFTPEM